MGSILDTVKNKQTNNITPTTTGGSIFRTVSGQISNQINEPQNKYLSGGFISDVADILGTGQYAITGGIESQLEKRGILRPSTTSGLKGGVKERKSNIGLLKRIGEETGKGGLLTGQYQPTQSVWGNFVRELPVTALGLAGDIMIDPLVVASKLGAVAKVTKTIGSAVKTGATAVASNMPAVQKIGDVLERLAITRGGQSEAFKLADKQRIINESLALEKTEKLVSDLIEAPSVIQQRMAQVLKGGITTRDDIRRMAEPIRQELDAVGEAITKVNPKLLSEETFLANKGTYLGNFFTKYIAPTEETRISTEALARGRKARIPTKEFTQRKDFAENIIEKVGDFFKLSSKDKQIVINATRDKDLPSLGGKLQKIRSDVENILERGQVTINDLKFQTSARRLSQIINERVRKSVGLIEEGGLPAAFSLQKGQLGLVRSKFFKELVDKGSVIDIPDETFRFQLPDSAQLGEATGKFVNRADYDAIMKTIMPDDGLTKLWKDGLRFWKTSKIAYNPSTIARNDLTNFLILNPLGGVGPHRLDIYYKTVKEFYEGGELWQRFRKVGGGLSSQSRGELIAKATELYKKNSNIRQQFKKVEDFHKAVVNFYGNQDTFFKFSNFIKGIMNDGLSDFAAMKRANFYLVDYSEVPKVVEWMRNSPIGAPFISFTYGVSLPLAKTLLERPDKLSAYFKILRAMQSLGADQTIDESILPENLKDQPYSALQMPFKDEFGRPQFIDMRYILPFNILEPTSIANNTLGSIPGISQFGQNPVMQFFGGILTNTNPYTGKKIVPDGSTPGEAIMAVIDYVQKIILPSLAPGIPTRVQGQTKIGGFGLEKLKSAIEKHPDFAGRERSVPKTLFDVLGGIKIQPVDLELQQRLQNSELKKQFEELRSQAVRTQLSKTMTKEEKEKELARLRQKVFELAQQLKERTK